MYVTVVHVWVKPAFVEQFKQACRVNHEASVKEPGNCRFDILQSAEDPNQFILYEAYQDQAAATAHKDTGHYLDWRQTVEAWMAKPRQSVRYQGLYPQLGAGE